MQGVWGWICADSKKFHCSVGASPKVDYYGSMSSHRDVIGVLLSFDNISGVGSLTFYKNGLAFEPAYESIPPGAYHPMMSMHSHDREGQECFTTLNSKARTPVGNIERRSFGLGGGGGEEE